MGSKNNYVTLTGAQIRVVHRCRHSVLRNRGYKVICIRSCLWKAACRSSTIIREYLDRVRSVDVLQVMPDTRYITTKEAVLQGLLNEKVFGIIVYYLKYQII